MEHYVTIDGQRIDKLPLKTLRSRISIIPQDCVLFSGSLRSNLDPFAEYADDDLWNVLNLVSLGVFVKSLERQLDQPVADGGGNFSAGQRQLFCFARALLRKSKIIIMDEATSNVDSGTDKKIQGMIRDVFKDQTVLCIAHRLDTILDSDKVCVLDAGKIVEFDKPQTLLRNNASVFYSLVAELDGGKNPADSEAMVPESV